MLNRVFTSWMSYVVLYVLVRMYPALFTYIWAPSWACDTFMISPSYDHAVSEAMVFISSGNSTSDPISRWHDHVSLSLLSHTQTNFSLSVIVLRPPNLSWSMEGDRESGMGEVEAPWNVSVCSPWILIGREKRPTFIGEDVVMFQAGATMSWIHFHREM